MAELTAGSTQQLMEVLEHVRRNRRNGVPFPTAFHDAVRDVANRHHVTYQTIGDFRRRLGFADINEFVALIGRWLGGDADPLRRRVKQHATPHSHEIIDKFFGGDGQAPTHAASTTQIAAPRTALAPANANAAGQVTEIRLRLAPATHQKLHLAQLAKVGATLEETAIALIEKGFDADKQRIRQFLDKAIEGP